MDWPGPLPAASCHAYETSQELRAWGPLNEIPLLHAKKEESKAYLLFQSLRLKKKKKSLATGS